MSSVVFRNLDALSNTPREKSEAKTLFVIPYLTADSTAPSVVRNREVGELLYLISYVVDILSPKKVYHESFNRKASFL